MTKPQSRTVSLAIKQVFEDIDFKTMIPTYLKWMKQILQIIQNEPKLLETTDIIDEYKEYIDTFIESIIGSLEFFIENH